jgi:hypothetical protein
MQSDRAAIAQTLVPQNPFPQIADLLYFLRI